jgi:cytidylate kinase
MCSLGDEIAAELASRLNALLVTRGNFLAQNFKDVASPADLRMLAESPKYYLRETASGGTFKSYLEDRLLHTAMEADTVIVGMGAQIIFSKEKKALHIRTIASTQTRVERVRKEYRVSIEEAHGILLKADRRHKRYVSTLYGADNTDASLYDLILNTDRLGIEGCVQAILALKEEKAKELPSLAAADAFGSDAHKNLPFFKNTAEEEFAGILDMYQMEWQYEPKTFPIEWDAEGNITMAFSPDFYLPKFDTYIEITTMNQKYVTTKNKKVRKLRELYPGVHISIVYKNDFNSLINRFKTMKGEHE